MSFTCTGMIILVWGQLTCSMPPAAPAASDFCTRYTPIYWSSADTRQTKERVDAMNRRWKKYCRSK